MQTKLTLRVEEAAIAKAKRVAKNRGSSVSKLFNDWISDQQDHTSEPTLQPNVASMVGILDEKQAAYGNDRAEYRKHLERKYL